MTREVFAQFCELKGARELYPDHYLRMAAEAERRHPSKRDGHHEALVLAADMLKDDPAPRVGVSRGAAGDNPP